jgi:hypothetical protein
MRSPAFVGCRRESGTQFVTLFSLLIAIILFGVLKILEGKELAALLGGLSGYVLGRGSCSERAPDAAGNNPAQNNPALGPMLNPASTETGAHSLCKFFQPAGNASPSSPAGWCLKLKAAHKELTGFYIYLQTSRSWESFSRPHLTPASTAGVWMPLRHPSTAAVHAGFGWAPPD